MKILAVGRNYAAHASELGNQVPGEPLIFMKPSTAILSGSEDFIYPDFTHEVHYEVELILKISKKGKNISRDDYQDYFEEVSVGIDFTARDLQRKCKEKGWPWEIAKGFDASAAIGEWRPKDRYSLNSTGFELLKNGALVQKGNTSNMIFSIAYMMEYMSKFFTLEPGDIIFTGTPEGVGPVEPGDHLEGKLEGEKILTCKIIRS